MISPAPADAPRRELGAALAMLVAALLWGATFVVLRDALVRVDPFALVFVRFASAALVFGAVCLARRVTAGRPAWIGGLASGAAMAGGYLFQSIGLTTIAAGSSAFLTSIGTLFAGVFAWPLLGQRPSGVLAIGLLLAAAGSALLSGGPGPALSPGEAWTLAGAFAFAFQVVALARFAPRTDTTALAAIQALTVAALLAPFALPRLGTLRAIGAADAARLAYLVVAGSLIAPWLQIRAQRVLSAGRIGLLFTMEPVFALLFALGVGGERYRAAWWAGALLILAAVLLVEGHAAWRSGASRRASA